jgi:hypothetical protein
MSDSRAELLDKLLADVQFALIVAADKDDQYTVGFITARLAGILRDLPAEYHPDA